jgi:hypothetical protein
MALNLRSEYYTLPHSQYSNGVTIMCSSMLMGAVRDYSSLCWIVIPTQMGGGGEDGASGSQNKGSRMRW